MIVRKGQWPILTTIVIFLVIFTSFFIKDKNFEFLIYVGVIVFFLLVILFTNERVHYPNNVLWGLTAWALLHMSGGTLRVGDGRLYEFMIIPISEAYQVFRYDQFVHIVGFAVATLAMYYVLKPLLRRHKRWTGISVIVVMAGLGVGALNEIVEFGATVIAPQTGVGGYINTSLDLVADLIGAVIAMIIIYFKDR